MTNIVKKPAHVFENCFGSAWKETLDYTNDKMYGCKINDNRTKELTPKQISQIENANKAQISINNFGDLSFTISGDEYRLYNDGFTGAFDVTHQEFIV